MGRGRWLGAALGGSVLVIALRRHLHGAGTAVRLPGGIVMGDAGGYDAMSGLFLGSLFSGIARDVASRVPVGASVLEVGCGPGHLAARMADAGLRVTGLDLDEAMIGRARVNGARRPGTSGPSPEFVVGDVAALPFPAASFDAVVSTLSMHHWADRPAGLGEIARVLRPDGRALVWDIRPGHVPLHGGMPDPLAAVHDVPLRVVSAAPWRWPWRLALLTRIELEPQA